MEAGQAYLDLRRLELAPALTREVASALSNGQFVNFGTAGGAGGGQSAAAGGSDDVLRVVQTLMAAQVITNPTRENGYARRNGGDSLPELESSEPDKAASRAISSAAPVVPPVPAKSTFRK